MLNICEENNLLLVYSVVVDQSKLMMVFFATHLQSSICKVICSPLQFGSGFQPGENFDFFLEDKPSVETKSCCGKTSFKIHLELTLQSYCLKKIC